MTYQIHRWLTATSDEIYDQTQTDENIKDGDILVVISEKIVGIMVEAWPTAITSAHGQFHAIDPQYSIADINGGKYTEAYEAALRLTIFTAFEDGHWYAD